MSPRRNFELRVPPVSEMFGLFLPHRLRTEARMQVLAPAEIKRMVRSVDGRECTIEDAREIYADRSWFVEYARARNGLLENLIEAGMVFAECPHCRAWEADLTPLALAIGLRVPFWPVSDDGLFLAVPSLAESTPKGARPAGAVLSTKLRAVAPRTSDGTGPGRELQFRADAAVREEMLWQEFARPGMEPPPGREQWRNDVRGFRAVLRLAAATELPKHGDPITPPLIMDFDLAELMFFDNVHHLLHDCDVPEDHGLTVRCGDCGGIFLPLL